MIRCAQPQDLYSIKRLIEACARALQELGIHQWNEHYPSKPRLEKDIQQKDLFVLEKEEEIVGLIVLTPFMDEEYFPVSWLTRNQNNLYIHRLAVQPNLWGKGYARKLMDFAESYAWQREFASVRLDTFSKNLRNQRFYEARGYQKLEDIYFPKQSCYPFHCYELVL